MSMLEKDQIRYISTKFLGATTTEGDEAAATELCELIRKGFGDVLLQVIKDSLRDTSHPTTALRALELLDLCVRQCSADFALCVSTEFWTDKLYNLAKKTKSLDVRDKVMSSTIQWAKLHTSKGLRQLVNRYAESKTLGTPFREVVRVLDQQRREQRAAERASPQRYAQGDDNAIRSSVVGPGSVPMFASPSPASPALNLPGRSKENLNNIELAVLEMQADLNSFELGLQRPDLYDEGMEHELRRHKDKVIHMIDRTPNLPANTSYILHNLLDEIEDALVYSDHWKENKVRAAKEASLAASMPPQAVAAAAAQPGRRASLFGGPGVPAPVADALATSTKTVDVETMRMLESEQEENARLRRELEETRQATEDMTAKYKDAKSKNKKALAALDEAEEEYGKLADEYDKYKAENAGARPPTPPPPPPPIIEVIRKCGVEKKTSDETTAQLQAFKHEARTIKNDFVELRKFTHTGLVELGTTFAAMLEALEEDKNKESKSFNWLQELYKKEIKLRKMYYNQIQELKGNIRVYCRVRPMSQRELDNGHTDVISFPSEDELSITDDKGRLKTFEFDNVFHPKHDQARVFEDTQPLIESVIDGFNVCIFAYGQTGTGKTHTMGGPASNPGINKRALNRLFECVAERADSETCTVHVSVMEIYNDNIFDLLVPRTVSSKTQYEIKTGGSHGQYVSNMTEEEVFSVDAIEDVMARAGENRSQASTKMNEYSSRSHMIVHIIVRTLNIQTQAKGFGKLSLVDLAGSERLDKSGAEGQAALEAMHINKSLSALGDVIASLSNSAKHVPFRNSKLTHFLSDSMSGQAKLLMFVCVSPASYNTVESISSLQFASRARGVSLGQVKKNVVS